jgi:nitroreductase
MDLFDAIKGRRSIRKYRPDPVSEESLQKVMESLRWTPSWANTQCWQVIVVKDPEGKTELLEAVSEANPAFPSIMEAPVLLILCGKKGIAGYSKGEPRTAKGDWLMFDTGLAMQNLCLAAYALGLGTVIIGAFDHKKAEKILGLPQDVEVVAMTPLGYPASKGATPRRKEVSEFVSYEKHQGK